jgi:hypothetical protein
MRAEDSLLVMCDDDKRFFGSFSEGAMTDALFEINARRFFETADRTGRTPERESITLPNGRPGRLETLLHFRDAGPAPVTSELAVLGVTERDGSALILTCGAPPGRCKSDLVALYTNPPAPTRTADGARVP